MKTIRKDVQELISDIERIQSALAQGHRFTEDEKDLMEICAGQLITYVGEGERFRQAARRSSESSDGAQF